MKANPNSKSQQALAWLKENPDSTSTEVAKAIGWTTTRVATTFYAAKKQGKMTLREVKKPGAKRPTYYWTVGAPSLPKPEPAVIVEMPKAVTHPELVAQVQVSQLDVMVNQLAEALANQVVSKMQASIVSQMRQGTKPLEQVMSADELVAKFLEKTTPPDTRKKVLIAGLLPNQAGIIQHEFGEVFNLRYFTVGENLQHLKSMLTNVDHVFTFTSKIPHAVEEIMRSAGYKINRCSGGMTMLKDMLLDLYTNGKVE